MLEVLRRLGSIQFDPIAVAGRNHDLMLHARVDGYEPAWCDELYERREIFETTNKALSFIPADEFPWYRVTWAARGRGSTPRRSTENAAVAEQVLERIRADGPLSSADFEQESGATKNWFGLPENAVRSVLEAYTVAGVIGLARREGNRRYYDLVERLLPAELLAREVPEREQLLHKLLSRYRAHGLLGAGGAGGTFARIANPDVRRALHAELVERGELVPVAVEGMRGKRFVVGDGDRAARGAAGAGADGRVHRPVRLAPLGHATPREPVRLRVRVGGLLQAGEAPLGLLRPADPLRRPVRRPDRAADRPRERTRVEVLGLWWEDGFAPRRADGFVEAMREALGAYMRFAGADRLEWAPHLAAREATIPSMTSQREKVEAFTGCTPPAAS